MRFVLRSVLSFFLAFSVLAISGCGNSSPIGTCGNGGSCPTTVPAVSSTSPTSAATGVAVSSSVTANTMPTSGGGSGTTRLMASTMASSTPTPAVPPPRTSATPSVSFQSSSSPVTTGITPPPIHRRISMSRPTRATGIMSSLLLTQELAQLASRLLSKTPASPPWPSGRRPQPRDCSSNRLRSRYRAASLLTPCRRRASPLSCRSNFDLR